MPLLPAVLAILIATEAPAPARHDLEALLSRPLSPGVVILLTPYLGSDPRAVAKIVEGLTHADAAVRAAAGRVAYVNGVRAALPVLRERLPAEQDRTAAIEMMRAALVLGGPESEEALQPVAERHRAVRQLVIARNRTGPEPAEDAEPRTRILITAALPPGALKDALAVAGCKPKRDLTAGALVAYRPDGRARRVALARLKMSRACQEVATAAVPLALAPAGVSAEAYAGQNVVYVALDPSPAECADEPEPQDMRRVGEGTIKEPRKVKHVDPRYPAPARAGLRQGTVVLEAVLGETGCVRSLTILKGASADLDLATLRAVSLWRFTPTLVDGVPVSVFMTVSVNYRLN